LKPGTTKVVSDDAVFNATGSDRGSTAGDFKAVGCLLVRAGKMNAREANGLALVRTMLQESGRDPKTPWLMWTQACQGLMATWPTLPRHPRDVERIADGCANHSLNAVRYGLQWWRAKWKQGQRVNLTHLCGPMRIEAVFIPTVYALEIADYVFANPIGGGWGLETAFYL